MIKKLCPNKEENEVHVFFQSIAMSVKKLNPDLVCEARMKSLQMVCELESRNSQSFMPVPLNELRGGPGGATTSNAFVPSPTETSGNYFSDPTSSENSLETMDFHYSLGNSFRDFRGVCDFLCKTEFK